MSTTADGKEDANTISGRNRSHAASEMVLSIDSMDQRDELAGRKEVGESQGFGQSIAMIRRDGLCRSIGFAPHGKSYFLRDLAEQWALYLRPRDSLIKHAVSAGCDGDTVRRTYNRKVRSAVYLKCSERMHANRFVAVLGMFTLSSSVVLTLILLDSWWYKTVGIISFLLAHVFLARLMDFITARNIRHEMRVFVQVMIVTAALLAAGGTMLMGGDLPGVLAILNSTGRAITPIYVLGCALLWMAVSLLGITTSIFVVAWLAVDGNGRRIERKFPSARILTQLVGVLDGISKGVADLSYRERQRLVDKIYISAALVSKVLPRAIRLSHPEGRAALAEHYKAASATLRLCAVWLALPSEENVAKLRENLMTATVAIVLGMHKDLPVVADSRVSPVERARGIGRLLRTLAVGAIPLGSVFLAELAGISLDTTLGNAFKVGAVVWAAVTYVSLLDPLLSQKVELMQGISNVLPTSK